MRILVVEDEPKMAAVMKRGLEREGYAVDVARDGREALWAAREFDYDVIVLDAIIPPPDGWEVCRALRREQRWMPVLMVTASTAVDDRVLGLDAGADDCLTKPFAFAELFARLRSLTRRELGARPPVLSVGDLHLDGATHEVRRGDVPIALSPKQFAVLEQFMRRPGETLSRTELLEHVWDFAYQGTSNLVDVYVLTLRQRIDHPFGRESIETVRGAGYRLRQEARTQNSSRAHGGEGPGGEIAISDRPIENGADDGRGLRSRWDSQT
jgi:two-component system OmpR family response regulator